MTYKRTILVSGFDASVRMRNRQLIVSEGDTQRGSVPLDEIAMLVIDTPLTVLTNAALTELANAGGTVVLCDSRHMPAALVLPVSGNCLHAERLRTQMACSVPVGKRIWQQLIRAKILNQAQALRLDGHGETATRLDAVAAHVRSGDPDNREALAAQIYWQNWATPEHSEFRRDPEGDAPNSLLNYGYAVIRAAVARALVAAGLHPAIGVWHRNRTNAYALADDAMEPFRPFVDRLVRRMYFEQGVTDLTRDAKASLLALLPAPCRCGGHAGSLLNAAGHLANSLVNMMEGTASKLKTPEFPDPENRTPERGEEDTDDDDECEE